MGKKLDAILGRSFKTHKFKALANRARSRFSVFKNRRQVLYNQARSDVIQLLQIGDHDRALRRVRRVMDSYCSLLIERVSLIEQERQCPDELREAIASLLYASSRCGDFPELQEIRSVFTTRYGKEFVSSAIELRNNCRVNPRMIQKLSTRQPGVEDRMMLLKEIASEKRITLKFEESSSVSTEEKLGGNKNQNRPDQYKSTNSGSSKLGDDLQNSPKPLLNDGFSDSMKTRKKYRDTTDAAQEAFEFAAYAAEAARAAVKLSRADNDSDDQNNPSIRRKNAFDADDPFVVVSNQENREIQNENQAGQKEVKTMSASSSDSEQEIVMETMTSPEVDYVAKLLEKEMVFDESDDEVQQSKGSSSVKDGGGLVKSSYHPSHYPKWSNRGQDNTNHMPLNTRLRRKYNP